MHWIKAKATNSQTLRIAVLCVVLSFIFILETFAFQKAPTGIPFRLEHGEIVVSATIGAKGAAAFMLDTDSDPSTVDVAFARMRELKLKPLRGSISGGGSERPDIYLTELPNIAVGTMPGRNLQVIALDLSKVRDSIGADVQGVLGNDFLTRRVVEIDYPHSLIRFSSSPLPVPNATRERVTLPFKFDDKASCILIEGVTVNGKSITATIDTGSDGGFKLTPTAVKNLQLTDMAENGTVQASNGYKGVAQNTLGTLKAVTIGSITVNNPAVVFFGPGTGRDSKPWGLNIGNEFLKDYILSIDYLRKVIILDRP
jgi:hypothetical protein